MTDPAACLHEDFTVVANVERVKMADGPIGAMLVHVSLSCTQCGSHFWFPGLPSGRAFAEPTTSMDGFTASLPIVREGLRCTPDPALPVVLIRTADIHKGHQKA